MRKAQRQIARTGPACPAGAGASNEPKPSPWCCLGRSHEAASSQHGVSQPPFLENEVAHSCCESRVQHLSTSLLQAARRGQRTPVDACPRTAGVAGPPDLMHVAGGQGGAGGGVRQGEPQSSEHTTVHDSGALRPAWPGPPAALS